MARHEHLPIYKAALDMTVHFEKLVAGFSRYHKYTLGTELREGTFVAQRGESGGGLMRRVPVARWVAGREKLADRERPV